MTQYLCTFPFATAESVCVTTRWSPHLRRPLPCMGVASSSWKPGWCGRKGSHSVEGDTVRGAERAQC